MREGSCIEKTKLDVFIRTYNEGGRNRELVVPLERILNARDILFDHENICYVDLSMAMNKLEKYSFVSFAALLKEWCLLMEKNGLIYKYCDLPDDQSSMQVSFVESQARNSAPASTRSSIVEFLEWSFVVSKDSAVKKTSHPDGSKVEEEVVDTFSQ